jgi:hypothetical protein
MNIRATSEGVLPLPLPPLHDTAATINHTTVSVAVILKKLFVFISQILPDYCRRMATFLKT